MTVRNTKFHEVVNAIAVQHCCSLHDVLDFASHWLTHNSMSIEELTRTLDIYGGMRDLGHGHESIKKSFDAIVSASFLGSIRTKKTKPCIMPCWYFDPIHAMDGTSLECMFGSIPRGLCCRKEKEVPTIRLIRDD